MVDERFPQSILHHRWDDRIVYLTLVYLDGISTPGESQELQALLRDDAQKRDLFVSLCIQASQIMELENPNRSSVCPMPDNVEDVTPEKQVGIPTSDQISIETCDYHPESVAKQSPWEENVRKETIRQFAEESLETYKKEEKQRQEALAYKAYLARRRQLIVGISSLAALVAIVLFVWLAPVPVSPESEGLPKLTPPQLVATIVKSVKAQWKPCDYPIISEERLFSVPMVLTQGLVQIEFDDGAEVILQAPCEFELQSAGKMFLQSGAVCAKVSQRAHGFTVETPGSSVVDYGTEFGVLVANGGLGQQCEIHVFDGIVGVRSNKERQSPVTYLKRGQAAIAKATGNVNIGRISHSDRYFVQRLFGADSGLIGWWRFDEESGNVVKDSSGNGHDGMIVGGTEIVTDPVRGQVLRNVIGGSVDLYNVNNPIPSFAANSSITLAAWVKREGGTQHSHSYVIQLGQDSDHPIATLGIKPKGEIMSYVETNQPGFNQDQIDLSGGVVEGRDVFTGWHHIAVVYDRTTDMATTYIDGLVDRRTDISLLRDDYAFTWTAAHLGADSDNARQYIGLMDDVAIFNGALTEVEIRAVMVGRILALIEK
jgi:hypothetical protein